MIYKPMVLMDILTWSTWQYGGHIEQMMILELLKDFQEAKVWSIQGASDYGLTW